MEKVIGYRKLSANILYSEWHLLCKNVLMDEELAVDPRFCEPTLRVENRAKLNAIIETIFKGYEADALKALLLKASIAFGELNTVEGLMNHPILREVEYANEEGTPVVLAAPPVIDHDSPTPEYRSVPKLGEHSEKIRKDFGAMS